jgi:phage FluMu gp28-like protein
VLVSSGTWADVETERIDEETTISTDEKEAVIVRVMVTLRKMSFEDQKNVVRELLKKYRVKDFHIDQTGIGMNLAEDLKKEFPGIVKPVWFTRELKEEIAINLKKLFEDKKIIIPGDSNLISQIHAIKRVPGATGFIYDSGRNAEIGHADKFWALALACRSLGFRKKTALQVRII